MRSFIFMCVSGDRWHYLLFFVTVLNKRDTSFNLKYLQVELYKISDL